MCDCCDKHNKSTYPIRPYEWALILFIPALILGRFALHLAYDSRPAPVRMAVCHVPHYAEAVTPAQNPSPYLHQKSAGMECIPCHDDTSVQGVLLGK